MRVEQISIFLENKTGRIAEVTSVLAEAGINIRALSLADTSDFGVLRLIVDNTEKAESTLKEKGFTVGKTSVIAVAVEDAPGGLNRIMQILTKENVNVEYMYTLVHPKTDTAVMVFRFDNLEAAAEILRKNGVTVFEGNSVYSL